MVKLYSTKSCSICRQAEKDMLGQGISYSKIDVEDNQVEADTMLENTGNLSVPQFNINGEWVVGYHRGILEKMVTKEDDDFFDSEVSLYTGELKTCVNCEG